MPAATVLGLLSFLGCPAIRYQSALAIPSSTGMAQCSTLDFLAPLNIPLPQSPVRPSASIKSVVVAAHAVTAVALGYRVLACKNGVVHWQMVCLLKARCNARCD